MKQNHLIKKAVSTRYPALTLLVMLIMPVALRAQQKTVKIDTTVKHHLDEVEMLLADLKKHKDMLVPDYSFEDSLKKFQNMASGTVIKNGKVQSISTVLDDKSLTFNYTLPIKSLEWMTIQPTISGASSKGFINVFTGDKYGRTLTGGVNFNFTIKGTANFDTIKRDQFKLKLKNLREKIGEDHFLTELFT
jgi:hypothetical protein